MDISFLKLICLLSFPVLGVEQRPAWISVFLSLVCFLFQSWGLNNDLRGYQFSLIDLFTFLFQSWGLNNDLRGYQFSGRGFGIMLDLFGHDLAADSCFVFGRGGEE